jgi:hypothetical protein
MKNTVKGQWRLTLALVALLLSLGLIQASALAGKPSRDKKKSDVVYVCSCLKTKSCSCMTEAKTEGPCSCGTQGGPPLKKVSAKSAWAKANREALAK